MISLRWVSRAVRSLTTFARATPFSSAPTDQHIPVNRYDDFVLDAHLLHMHGRRSLACAMHTCNHDAPHLSSQVELYEWKKVLMMLWGHTSLRVLWSRNRAWHFLACDDTNRWHLHTLNVKLAMMRFFVMLYVTFTMVSIYMDTRQSFRFALTWKVNRKTCFLLDQFDWN